MANSFTLSADDCDIEETLSGNAQYQVPDYQREYSWTEDQWQELWDDLHSLLEQRENHFLGSIVIIKHEENGLKKKDLVDGQQRLSTLMIILAAIRDRLADNEGYDHVETVVEDMLFFNSKADGEEYQRLELNNYHNSDFRNILEANFKIIEDSQIKECYDYYSDIFEKLPDDKVEEIRKKLISSMKLVEIECGSELSAYRLFQSLNDKGLDLSEVDLLKNRLFEYAAETDSVDESEIKSMWEEIVNEIRPEMSARYRFFCHYFMSTPKPETSDNVSKRKLYDHLEYLIEEGLESESMTVEDLLSDMVDKSKLYVRIVNCNVKGQYNQQQERKINNRLEACQLKNKRIRTLLLRIIDEYDNPEEIIEALSILEVLNVRAKVAGRDSNTSRDRFWSRACSVMTSNSDNPNRYLRRLVSERAPSDTVLVDKMQNREFKNNDFTKYILDQIEQRHYMKSTGKSISDRSVVDIEDIAPQRSFSAKKYSEWQQYLNCSEEEFEEYKKRMGNLTLLENKVNRSMGDDPYQIKKDHYLNETEFKMSIAVGQEYDEWRIEQIKDRSKKMAQITAEIWSINNV